MTEGGRAAGILAAAPGPSPWYVGDGHPPVPGFTWRAAGDSGNTAGATLLSDAEGVVLILDFYNYVLPLDPDTLLVWHQAHVEEGPTAPVVLRVLRLSSLRPLEADIEALCRSMREREEPLVASGPPVCEHGLPTTVAGEPRRLSFPEPLDRLEELLILCHSSGVEDMPNWERHDLALLAASPREGRFELYPQDWFNHGDYDYEYQWVTRVARDPRTDRIHGDGIRISPFVLDESLRGIL